MLEVRKLFVITKGMINNEVSTISHLRVAVLANQNSTSNVLPTVPVNSFICISKMIEEANHRSEKNY